MSKETIVADYLPFLLELGESGKDYFVEGGQAVNFWAEYYSSYGTECDLSGLKPFTSEDCDLCVSPAAWEYLKLKEKKHLQVGNSPADGQLGILRIGKEPVLEIDLLGHVFGFSTRDPKELKKLQARAVKMAGIYVLDPVCLFRSKAACLCGLPQGGRQDEKHFRIMCEILPDYLLEMFSLVREEPSSKNEISERAMISELKLILKYCKLTVVKESLAKINAEVNSILPVEAFKESGFAKVAMFAERSLCDF